MDDFFIKSTPDIFAHTKKNSQEKQLLSEHLSNVSRNTKEYCRDWAADAGALVGAYHDIGKCASGFQERLNGGPIVDHSTAGAKLLYERKMILEAMCVAGHHGGLQNLGSKVSCADNSFKSRMRDNKKHYDEYRSYENKVVNEKVSFPKSDYPVGDVSRCLYAHMLFSSLVDADWNDTAEFCEGLLSGENHLDIQLISNKILDFSNALQKKKVTSAINIERNKIRCRCIEKASEPRNVFTLSVPTGSGKTIASLTFAAQHIKCHKNLRRIIYVIPYISIIEQTACVIREIVGDDAVLEHHSMSNDLISDEEKASAAENWDIPIVVTTNEQFFESLFSNQPSRCRKLHNITDSIIIFDEAQMFPVAYQTLCTRSICSLVDDFGSSVILCSATNPGFELFSNGRRIEPIISSNDYDKTVFLRNQIERIKEELSFYQLSNLMQERKTALAIVNRKDFARRLYDELPDDSRFILTTDFTPMDRIKILREIKSRLKRNEPCYVAATSLVECGVDFDFQTVYREVFGLDSIIQSAGRCNREGLRPKKESFTYIFEFSEHIKYSAEEQRKINCVYISLGNKDINRDEVTSDYFKRYYKDEDTNQCMEYVKEYKFETLSDSFKIIKESSVSVIVPGREVEELFKSLNDDECIDRKTRRTLALYSVKCRRYQFEKLMNNGKIKLFRNDEDLPVLNDLSLYGEKGLRVPEEECEVVTW